MDRTEFISEFFRHAQKLPHLPGPHDLGIFLAGSYLYLDCGEHVESVTVECCNPWDLLKSRLAGEAIISQVAEDVITSNPDIGELILSKVNVDYAGMGSTWGEHESYLIRKNPVRFDEQQIIPHLVSRILYTGAGGWHSTFPGLIFVLSPRVPFYTHVISRESTKDRGIFHTKDEPLAGSEYTYKRLHMICGEGLFSHKASLLKSGVTALIVRLVDSGKMPGEGVRLRSPLQSLNVFARDTRCTARAETISGESLTAVNIQRHYLSQVRKYITEMPAWAPEICRLWEETLDALESNPLELNRIIDWPTKLEIFTQYIESSGFSWDEIHGWNQYFEEVNEVNDSEPSINAITNGLLSRASRIARIGFLRILRKHRLNADRLSTFLRLREKLFEIDIRCGQIGDKGIFSMLDRQGMLRHHVEGINNDTVEQAKENPPDGSRARIRGDCIKRFADNPQRYKCHWTHITDLHTKKVLNLRDPFEARECWEVPVFQSRL